MEILKVIEIKRLRALILTSLYESVKGVLLVSTLKKAFQANYSTAEVEKQIEYLKEREYIRELNPDEQIYDDIVIKITDKGQDVVEGTTDDPGVGF
jgi:predicted transcriptional regulator